MLIEYHILRMIEYDMQVKLMKSKNIYMYLNRMQANNICMQATISTYSGGYICKRANTE